MLKQLFSRIYVLDYALEYCWIIKKLFEYTWWRKENEETQIECRNWREHVFNIDPRGTDRTVFNSVLQTFIYNLRPCPMTRVDRWKF